MKKRWMTALVFSVALVGMGCDDETVSSVNEEDQQQTLDTASSVDTSAADSTPGDDLSADTMTGGDSGAGDTSTGSDTNDASTTPDISSDTSDVNPPDTTSEDCSNGVDDDNDNIVDCLDTDCDQTPVCTTEICDNGVDDDRDNQLDCVDLECRLETSCLVENCTNGKDDNGDGAVDCLDATCTTAGICTGATEVCDNGGDDDGDTFIDCRDPDCWDTTDPNAVACTNRGNAVTCTAEGQQCNPQAGFVQNGLFCAGPGIPNLTQGYPGAGLCLSLCDPGNFGSCPFGQACFDPDPTDPFDSGLCFAKQCDEPFTTNGCTNNDECKPLTNGYNYCGSVGTVAEDGACVGGPQSSANEKCVSGLVCLAQVCVPACDLAAPSCDSGETCLAVFPSLGYGVCDVECPAFSNGACGTGQACTPDFTGVWVCRPDSGLGEGDACTGFQECGEGLACLFGECQKTCSFFASGDCTASEVCVGFDPNVQFGICSEACTGYFPDDCLDAAERCIELSTNQFACQPHGGAGLGDSCANFVDCGQDLFCDDQTGACTRLCLPYDSTSPACGGNTACLPFDSTSGGCYPTTRTGTAQGDSCNPRDALCGDVLYCGQGAGALSVCYKICRVSESDFSGRNNADCGSTNDVCNPDFGWADLGICF